VTNYYWNHLPVDSADFSCGIGLNN